MEMEWNKIKLILYSFKFYDLWLKDSYRFYKEFNNGNWRLIFRGSKLKNLNVIDTKYLFIIFLEIDKRELGALAYKE